MDWFMTQLIFLPAGEDKDTSTDFNANIKASSDNRIQIADTTSGPHNIISSMSFPNNIHYQAILKDIVLRNLSAFS